MKVLRVKAARLCDTVFKGQGWRESMPYGLHHVMDLKQ